MASYAEVSSWLRFALCVAECTWSSQGVKVEGSN
jgi:hypothetical protein